MSGFVNNSDYIWKQYCELTRTEMNRAVRNALRAGAKVLQQRTRENVTTGIKTRNNHPGLPYNKGNIEDAVRLGKIESGYGSLATDASITVSIYGTKKADSKTFRLRFLEKGTKDRYQKSYSGKPLQKPRYLGKITGRWFFKNAQREVIPNLDDVYLAEIVKTINKINSTDLR